MGGRHHVRRRLSPERSGAVDLQFRSGGHRDALSAFRQLRAGSHAPPRHGAGPAGLRLGAQVLAHLQLAGRPGSHQRHGADKLHRPGPPSRPADRRGLLEIPGTPWVPAPGQGRQGGAGAVRQETLLLEIGMEECPARFVGPALEELGRLAAERLADARIAHGAVRTLGTPRRLAVLVEDVAAHQAELTREVKGPPARAAFDPSGAPTRAALGFAASQGVAVEELVVKETEGGAYVYAVRREAGRPTRDVLPAVLHSLVTSLKFPKSMRWGNGTLRFARPIRWLVALLGDEVVPFELEGVTAGRATRGHRTLADRAIELESAGRYVEVLREQGKILVDVVERRASILRQVETLARQAGGQLVMDEALLDEVTHLVEWPTALLGSFDPDFLEVPEEILITTMKEHQRYCPVRAGKLLPVFVAVRNGDETALDVVRAGNERVLAARLADARFFYAEDLKRPLADRVDQLKGILFQERLGSLWDKVERVRRIIRQVSEGYSGEVRAKAERAAFLAKADLVTQVVYEFPELQGVMGRAYALASGEDPEVAEAILEHYMPRHAHDRLPATEAGVLVSLADKADTIVGCFA